MSIFSRTPSGGQEVTGVVIDNDGLSVDFGDLTAEGWVGSAISFATSREDVYGQLRRSGQQIQSDVVSNSAFAAAKARIVAEASTNIDNRAPAAAVADRTRQP